MIPCFQCVYVSLALNWVSYMMYIDGFWLFYWINHPMSWNLFHNQTHPKLNVISALTTPLILFSVISVLFPSSILDTFQPEGFILQCYVFLHFHAVYGLLKPRILELFDIPSSTGPNVVRIHYNSPITGWICTAWLMASFCHASLFAMTRLCCMKASLTL